MSRQIALLRGINVSGHKIIKMELLRASFASLGFKDVRTYIQSGNVVFETTKGSAAALTKKIEQKILGDFGFEVPVFLTTPKELEEIIERCPFLKQPGFDSARLHVTFLSDEPTKTAVELLQPLVVKPEQFHLNGRTLYLHCPNGYGNTKLSNPAIEKKLGVGATTRNWKTVNTLLEMSQ